ncbi:MAG: DEAD/DEAH box helicase [Candidatus Zapsychrus exili]|nr:DEAD/DEAH box helicase [Candidatus Zapsychrus exili]
MGSFETLGLSEDILKVIKKKGFEEPSSIQEKTIPAILNGKKDIVAQAQTGTGKTAAFGLPIIELIKEKAGYTQALVLAPTRELAVQVSEEINSLKGRKQLSVMPIYGGQSISLQLKGLRRGVDIVVGTPGRVIDHLKRRTLKLDKVSFLVLDEADEMLNMGFTEEVSEILSQTNSDRQTLLFSATMPPEILKIAKKYMGDYDVIRAAQVELTVAQTDQIYFEVSQSDKFEALCRIIDIEEEFYGLVFCRTKVDVDVTYKHLIDRGYEADALHGDMNQSARERVLDRFKKKKTSILVATDVAARGIDVVDLTHVINFSIPQDPESYVHRIGRTGRAGKEGNAITFITPSEYRRFQFIQRKVKADIRKEKLPKVKDVINTKRARIKVDIEQLLKGDVQPEYSKMAEELLAENPAEVILPALLKHAFADQLNVGSYAQIEESSRVVDKAGTTRLFVTQGKRDGLSRNKLISLIENTCEIRPSKIKDVQVLDKFSFITLPFEDAEILLSYFKKKKRGTGPVIIKANVDKTRPEGDHGRSRSRGRNRDRDRKDRGRDRSSRNKGKR